MILSLVSLGLVAASASASRLESPTLDRCVRAGSAVQIVKLTAAHGDQLETAILGHGSGGVVLANQSDRDLCSWLPFARVLERAGYRVLVFDYGSAEPWIEVAAAAKMLHRLGVARVSLVGASEGAKASIVAAARDTTPVQVVASISAERYFRDGTDVKRSAARLARPILFVTAKNDPFAAADTPTLYRACSSPVKKLVTVSGDAHGIDLLSGAKGDPIRREILAFLRSHQ